MLKRISAYILLVAGVAGVAMPLLPGIPLLLVGLHLLGPEHPIRKVLSRWVQRRPRWMKWKPGNHE
jgi:uncharacterized membrane protein YbaN (DUF454 family)